jgi:asparagine synthase (glutamine-hydrolysing)
MAALLKHRGPDDEGVWADERAGIAFGFCRLAVLDLSPLGHQPMRSASGRYTVVYNGEIYNYRDLRAELEALGTTFRGQSDTEVLLACFERWGLDDGIRRLAGMFAIAVWDGERRELSLIRDRLGIKPLFVARIRGGIAFASELKAIRTAPGFDTTSDPEAVHEYLRYLYVPDPRTIYRDAWRLPPGHRLTIRDPLQPGATTAWWSLHDVVEQGCEDHFSGSPLEAAEALDHLLSEVVAQHMLADVPLGAFLSGGIDSSTVTALMQVRRTDRVRTYCIAFDDLRHDEARHAARVAAHLGTDHHEILVTGSDALAVVPDIPAMFDEPFADTSQIPAALLCRLARREVTVALSGEGGDEVFGGYNRYALTRNLLARAARLPPPVRRGVARLLSLPSQDAWDRASDVAGRLLPAVRRNRLPGEKIVKLARLLSRDNLLEQYRCVVSAWPNPGDLLVQGPLTGWDPLATAFCTKSCCDPVARLLLADQLTYLPGDQLTKVDRVSMAVGLEQRVPLLDHRVVEMSWKLPMEYKVGPRRGKEILRQVLSRYVPTALVDRPKVGFTVPLATWLRGPLREWAEDLLPSPGAQSGLLRPAPVRRAWRQFLEGRSEFGLGLWAVLMLRAWEESAHLAPAVGGARR